MYGKRCLLLTFVFCFFQCMKAQTSIKYTEENGLPTNHIYQVEQDAEGFIWFATNSGVVKFDGQKFKTFTTQEGLPTNDVWRIEATRDGKIWFFAKSKNLGYIQNDRVFSFPIDGGVAVQPRNFVINESEIFFTGDQNNRYGTFKLTDGRWQFMYSIGRDYFYELFLGKAILLFDGKKIRINNAENWLYDQNDNPLYQFKDVNPADLALINSSELPSKKIHFRERGIYCVLNFDGIIVYNFNDSTVNANMLFKDKETNSGKFTVPELQEFGDKFQISNGNEWILLDQKLNILERKQFDNNIPPVHIFKDTFGDFWTVNHETGIKVENTLHQSLKTYFDGRKVQTIAVQNGMVFLNVLNEGWYFRSAGMNDFKFLIPTYSRAYDMGFHDKFKLYYFLSGSYLNFGKNLFDLNAIERLYGRGLFYQYVGAKCILPTPTGFIGVNSDCVFKLDEKFDLLNADYRPDDPRFIRGINAITQFGNRIFLGGDGLYELIDDSVSVIRNDHPIVQAPIKTMFVHDDLLFIGTDGFGAYTYDPQNNIQFIKGTEGLSVNKIVVYKNLVWMATWKGLRYFEANGSGREYMLKGSVFDEDGLLSNRVNSMAVLGDELYLAFDNGLSVFKYSPDLYKRPFKTYLYNTSNYNKKTNTISAAYSEPINLSFGVLALPSQKYVKYYYKTNTDNSFTQTDNPNITFAEIEPGNYTVSFVAFDQHGNYGKSEVYLQILPAWYQTWWIKVIVGILLIVIIISITLYIRKNKEKKLEKDLVLKKTLAELELKALRSQMNPHFVFNSLNAIQYFIVKNKRELSEEYLAKFSQLVRLFFEYSKYDQLSITKEVDLLERYLEIEKIRFEDKLDYSVTVDTRIDADEMAVPSMILQPIVENAVNHGIFHKQGNGKVELRFDYVDENTIKVSVSDDGVGIEAMKQIQKKSLGTYRSKSSEVIKERLKILSENKLSPWYVNYSITDLSVLDNEKSGTFVEIVIIYK